MPRSSHPHLVSTLDQLDRHLLEHPRRNAQIVNLDAFRRHLEHTSDQITIRSADPHTAESQLRHELDLAFADLGGAAFALAHHGTLDDERLAPHVQRIHQIYTQLGTVDR